MNNEVFINETKTLLEMIGIPYREITFTLDSDLDMYMLSLRISGNEEELFTEHHNSLSRDLSMILKLLFEKKYHFYKDILLDVNGVNKKFIDQAKQKAQIALERVEFFDKPYEFGYLNGYERMLIHSYLKSYKNIVTASHGEGAERRLVINKKP